MQIKKVISGEEARTKMFNGIKVAAEAVAATMGPSGKNIAMSETWGAPKITKDGVSVCKSIVLPGIEGEGAKMLVQASEKTNKNAGDGTTLTCVLTKSIVEEGMKLISKGCNTTDIKKGIDIAVKNIVATLKKHSKPITSNEEIKQIATISANNDEEIGNMIAKAIDKVGNKGIITVEEGKGLNTELEIVEGYQFDQGYMSPYFITNPDKQTVEFDDPMIFMYDGKITSLQSILKMLEAVAKAGRPLVIIADDVESEPLTTLVVNHMQGRIRCCAVKAPSFGDIRKNIMEDMATLVDGEFISTQFGKKLEELTADCLGTCHKIKITATDTVIIAGNGDKEKIAQRANDIEQEIENTTSSYDKEKLRERLAKLNGGVAVIKVGGASEVEVKEKKDRVDDAACATRAALEEGILPGGGVALLKASKENQQEIAGYAANTTDDMMRGIDIVYKAVEAPLKTIVQNSGKSGDVVIEKVLEKSEFNYGYDARQETYGNMLEMGIVDACKVIRNAIENSSSVAGMLLTIEGLVMDDLDENLKMNQVLRGNQM